MHILLQCVAVCCSVCCSVFCSVWHFHVTLHHSSWLFHMTLPCDSSIWLLDVTIPYHSFTLSITLPHDSSSLFHMTLHHPCDSSIHTSWLFHIGHVIANHKSLRIQMSGAESYGRYTYIHINWQRNHFWKHSKTPAPEGDSFVSLYAYMCPMEDRMAMGWLRIVGSLKL